MKKRAIRLLCIVLALMMVVACVAGCSGDNGGEEGEEGNAPAGGSVSLNFSMGDPKTASKTIFYEGLAEKTKEATGGAVDVTVHSGGTLFAHLEVCEGVLSGGADMGWFYTPWNADQYPLTEVIGLPLQFGNQLATTYAVRQAYANYQEVQDELGAFEILNLYSGPMNYMYTSKEITGVADVQGLQFRTFAGAITNLITAWGGSPLNIGATEIYDAMDKGTIQGFIYEWSGCKSNALYEVIDYVTYLPLVSNPFTCIMNKASYAKIPADQLDTFNEIWAADQTSFDFALMFATENEESRKTGVEEYGAVEIIPDEEMLAEFQPAADQYIADWIAKYSTDTFDAGEYFEQVKAWYAEGCEMYPEWNI